MRPKDLRKITKVPGGGSGGREVDAGIVAPQKVSQPAKIDQRGDVPQGNRWGPVAFEEIEAVWEQITHVFTRPANFEREKRQLLQRVYSNFESIG